MDFFKEKTKKIKKTLDTWKILIADDDEAVHSLTKTVLADFEYQDKSLKMLSTYNGEDTFKLLKDDKDIVLVLLDVVMETDDAGLNVVRRLREELNNNLTQVILRTGQAGKAPELDVVKNYAINDYKEKTELTSQKLYTSIITAIRSYENIKSLESNKKEINKLNFDLNKSVQSFDKSVMAAKVDAQGIISYASKAFCKTTGYSQEELLKNKLSLLRHPDLSQKLMEELDASYVMHKSWSGELQYLTKSQQTLWLRLNRFPEFDNDDNFLHFMNIYEDITHKKEVESLNYDMKRLISTFDENVIASKTDIDGNITYVSEAFCKTSGFKKEELIGKKHRIVKHKDTSNEFYETLWSTITSKNIWQGEIKDRRKDGTSYWLRTTITPEYDIRGNFLSYTSVSENISDKKHIEKANIDIEILNTEIEETQKEVVFRMGAIGEARSKETGMHVKRVAEYSKTFALYLGIPEQKAEILKQASPMHDIGKVAIPDSILNKPGKHTPQEWEIMKSHAELGYKMLENSNKNILRVAAIVAHEHHEKWDGTGYPRGLKSNEINIYARITTVADVFDALTQKRIYKEPWSTPKVLDFFSENSGSHFDPELVQLLHDNIKEIERISDYSISLMEEVSEDIKKLSRYSSSKVQNKLDDINKKIDLARSE